MDLIPYHYVSLFRENIAKYPKREILMAKNEDSNQWEGISWEAVGDITTRLSRALLGMGILAQDTVGILSQICRNGHLLTLLACKYVLFRCLFIRLIRLNRLFT